MRALSDADVNAVRNAFHAVLAALPENRLRDLVLELLFAPFTTTTTQHRKVGRPPRKADVEGNVVPLQRNGPPRRRRRKGAVDESKLAERRKRYEAARKAKRQAAKAAMSAAATNGQDGAISAESFWRHAAKIEPKAPWKPVMREFGTNEAAAKHALKTNSLPPHVGPVAVERFLALQA